MRTILVTGFEPFGGETVNASWEAAQRLEGWRHGEFMAVARRLTCAYEASVTECVHAIETLRPAAVLMSGQAAQRRAVNIERFARNLDDATAPDNLGVLRRRIKINAKAPERLEALASFRALAAAIREAGLPARVSTNAGAYVCNHLYFGVLQYLRDRPDSVGAVFLHLPATPKQSPKSANAARLSPVESARALKAAAAAMVDR
jgi:pyroglutamyl-peptidase